MTETLSTAYQNGRTTSIAKRLADTVRERGIKRGMLSVGIARRVDSKAKIGDRMIIAGAEFTVKQ
ncbi:hypothetical protein [Chromohalobacter canadensis]|uniref:hypothetical protein n=1 Tax=Chromohalobacter canadensis TaxID=141389 RepID=UPI00240F1E51|nr:hypothetical protein [Chromohalobacter canadensis]